MEAIAGANKKIFILSGQSNMAGRGGVTFPNQWDGYVPPECQPNPNILRFSADLQWEQAREPLHPDIDNNRTCGIGPDDDPRRICGIGPGFPFATAIQTHDPNIGVVGLVPCAVGGSPIKDWERGCCLYENMVKRARESIKEGGEIKAILWYQGESDTMTQQDADAYKGNMEKLIHNVRSDLALPSLPFIQVAIATGCDFLENVREAQLGIDMRNVICVDAKGLGVQEDHIHITMEAQLQLGKMLADAYIKNFVPITSSSCNP